jgi:hypothetical protein
MRVFFSFYLFFLAITDLKLYSLLRVINQLHDVCNYMFNRLEPAGNFSVPQGLTFKNSTLLSHGIFCVLY